MSRPWANARFAALVLAARAVKRLPIPARWRDPVVESLGTRAVLLAFTGGATTRVPDRDERPTDA